MTTIVNASRAVSTPRLGWPTLSSEAVIIPPAIAPSATRTKAITRTASTGIPARRAASALPPAIDSSSTVACSSGPFSDVTFDEEVEELEPHP